MRGSIFSIVCCIVCFAAIQPASAVTKYAAGGVYDAEEQENAVDKSASYNPDYSTGAGMNESLILDFHDFSPLITAAFTNERGGVADFDSGLIAAGTQTDSFAVLFNKKAVLFRSADHIRSDYVSSSRTPISGPGSVPNGGFLAKSMVMGDNCKAGGSYQLTLTEYRFEPNEHVRVVAGTILGRNNSDKNGEWIMKVTLDNGDIIAASAVVDMSGGNTADDTFFSAYAPAGRYISGVSWICSSGEFSGLDDLAFITGTSDFIPPESEFASKPDTSDTAQPMPPRLWSPGDDSGSSILFGKERPSW